MADKAEHLHKLKRKHISQRSNATRFINQITSFDHSTPRTEIEHILDRLQDTLNKLITLDDSVQDMLDDTEYNTDFDTCEEYIDNCKRAICKAKDLTEQGHESNTVAVTDTTPTQPPRHTTTPDIKLQTFSGNIEEWYGFWEQFHSSIDQIPAISSINNHVLLRGYLDGEPKLLVDAIPVSAETYEQTKQILTSRYGDKNRIIQSHLDFLENLEAATSDAPKALNAMFIECHRRVQALNALGENTNSYGRILTPKLLRAFPEDYCTVIRNKGGHINY